MLMEFASLQLSREELQEIHAALVQRAMLEDELREEREQEAVERRPLLERIEMLLGETEEALHMQDHQLDDEMWEYAWYVFTDEWAYYRAKRDVEQDMGAGTRNLDRAAFEKLIQLRYQKNFDAYVAELAMSEGKKKVVLRSAQNDQGSRQGRV